MNFESDETKVVEETTKQIFEALPEAVAKADLKLLAKLPAVWKIPHTNIGVASVAVLAVAAQQQIAVFFKSDGAVVIDPDTAVGPFFEVPIAGPLPEVLNF